MKPLLQLAEDPRKPTIVPAATVTKIFRNVDMILNFNEKLLTALTTCGAVENKVTRGQFVSLIVSGGLHTKLLWQWMQIGRIFIRFAPFFKMYSAYIDGAEESMETVHQLEASNKVKSHTNDCLNSILRRVLKFCTVFAFSFSRLFPTKLCAPLLEAPWTLC